MFTPNLFLVLALTAPSVTSQTPASEANAVKNVVNYYMDNTIQIPIAQGYKLMALKNGVEYSKTGSFAYSIDFDGVIVK